MTTPRRSPAAALLVGLIALWQRAGAWRTPRCRFHPTCSAYARTAVLEHGAVRGGWLAVRRIGRCHPWNPGGVDHVPARRAPASTGGADDLAQPTREIAA